MNIDELQMKLNAVHVALEQSTGSNQDTSITRHLEEQERILQMTIDIRKEISVEVEKENYDRAAFLKPELLSLLKSLDNTIDSKVTFTKNPPPPAQTASNMSQTQKIMRRTMTKMKVFHYREETATHHGYHPDEWKVCFNRVQNTTFWVHKERGTISKYNPAELHPEHQDPLMREVFHEVFAKVVNEPSGYRGSNGSRDNTNDIGVDDEEHNTGGICKSILICCGTCCCNTLFVACCPCLCCLECMVDPHNTREHWTETKCLSLCPYFIANVAQIQPSME